MLKKRCEAQARSDGRTPRHVHVPFRESNLTKVLRSSFTQDNAHISVIATASPSSVDSEHSVSTFRTACMLSGRENLVTEAKELVVAIIDSKKSIHPSKWTAQQVSEWVLGVDGGRFAGCAMNLPHGCTGKQLTRFGPTLFTRFANGDKIMGKALMDELNKAKKSVGLERAAIAEAIREVKNAAAKNVFL